MKRTIVFVISFIVMSGFVAAADCVDHGTWGKILDANVNKEGLVDYAGVRINKGGGNLFEYLTYLEIAELQKCRGIAAKKAFWINAYNANVFRLVTARAEPGALSKNDSFFREKFYAANESLSLAKIRNRVIRADPEKGGPIKGVSIANYDPKILFALTNGTKGAPALSDKAYEEKTLPEQINAAAVKFVNDPKNVRVENGVLVLSEIFKWYAKDFEAVGGVKKFIVDLTDPARNPDAQVIDAQIATDYPEGVIYEYDWNLNEAPAPE